MAIVFSVHASLSLIHILNDTQYTVGSLASAMSGPAMAVAIGYALHCPPLVLFSLITVGFASNALGGAGAVSYTHLDVYKRQVLYFPFFVLLHHFPQSASCHKREK